LRAVAGALRIKSEHGVRMRASVDPVRVISRKPRQILNREAVAEILRERRGDIPLQELMKRISA
jgi:hypothetical protein